MVWFGEPNSTGNWQPVDFSLGKALRDGALGDEYGLGAWLHQSAANRKRWEGKAAGGKAKVDLQFRRLMALQFVGKSWEDLCMNPKYEKMHTAAWVRTGCLLTANGDDDDKVQPQGLTSYKVPA